MFHPKDTTLEEMVPYIVSLLRPDVYLELGVRNAITIHKVGKASPNTKRIGVDISFPRLRPEQSGYVFYEMTTNAFFEKLKKEEIKLPPFDLVFIDADHSYEQIEKDFFNVFPFVAEHGLILLHDTYPPIKYLCPDKCDTAYIAAENLRDISPAWGFEICTFPCPPGITLIRKASTQLPYETNYGKE